MAYSRFFVVWALITGLFSGSAGGIARSGALTPLERLLGRKALPDATLMLRLIDAEAELLALRMTYGVRHPLLRHTTSRVAFLRLAARRAPEGGAAAAGIVARGLRHRLQKWHVQVGLLGRKYGARHPKLIAARRRLTLFRGLLQKLKARGISARPVPPSLNALVVERAAARGRMRYYLTRYGSRHPLVLATRATIKHADRELRGRTYPPTGAACRTLWQQFSLAIARHRGRLGSRGTSRAVSAEVGSALDSLIAERAGLRGVAGCP